MKKIITAALIALTLATPVSATSEWDYFWGTTVHNALDPKKSGWDYFWGTSLNTQQTGWDDFWNQCQDANKTVGDCIGTVATGIGLVVASPIILLSATNTVGFAVISIVGGGPATIISPSALVAAA